MDIIRVIQEAATWIEKVNPDFEVNLYRTKELSPEQYYYQIPDTKKAVVVSDLINKRSDLIRAAQVELIPVPELVNYGRVMFFDANDTVVDGAPELASGYYVDIGDAPPWDTWLAIGSQLNAIDFCDAQPLTSNLLIAWVPKSQYFYAQQAIEVACLDNFEWPNNEFISARYAAVKGLFQKPESITEPIESINWETRKVKLQEIMTELEENSETYYRSINTAKKSIWKRIFR
jgi:hypothetical protein